MGLNESLDKLVKMRQAACDHNEQDVIKTEQGSFCICGVKVR